MMQDFNCLIWYRSFLVMGFLSKLVHAEKLLLDLGAPE